MTAHMASAQHGRLLIAVHNARPPRPEEWGQYIDLLRVRLVQAGPASLFGLTFTDGGAPDAPMRARMRESLSDGTISASLVSDSAVVRAVAGIIQLSNRGGRIYSPADWRAALDNVGVAPGEWQALAAKLRQMDAEVGGCASLRPLLAELR